MLITFFETLKAVWTLWHQSYMLSGTEAQGVIEVGKLSMH